MEITIEKDDGTSKPSSISMELYQIDPNTPKDGTLYPFLKLENRKTPFKEIITGQMLQDDGNYKYSLLMESKEDKVRGGQDTIAMFPVKTREIIVWDSFEKIILLLLGAGIALGAEWLIKALI